MAAIALVHCTWFNNSSWYTYTFKNQKLVQIDKMLSFHKSQFSIVA
jgi:uncharacterized protein YodC (DUF2158 family)